jgi:hypothetical protein
VALHVNVLVNDQQMLDACSTSLVFRWFLGSTSPGSSTMLESYLFPYVSN